MLLPTQCAVWTLRKWRILQEYSISPSFLHELPFALRLDPKYDALALACLQGMVRGEYIEVGPDEPQRWFGPS